MVVDEVLKSYLNMQITDAQRIDSSYGVLWSHISDLVFGGGKRLRPKIMLNTYLKYGGSEPERVLPIAAAWEILHVGLLIHDDIMDGDLTRRGKPTIEAIYNDRSVAILAGDLCLAAPIDLILQSELSNFMKVKVSQHFQLIIKEVIGGQLLDIDAKAHDPLMVAEHKTASYTFVGPMLCGAILAGARTDKLISLREEGLRQGIIFQLQNDLEDVEQDLAAGRHSAAIQAMEDLGSLDDAKAAIEQLIINLAEREGFEPSMELPPYRLSKAAH